MALDPLLQLLVKEQRIDAERAAVVAAHAEREHLGVDTSLLSLGVLDEHALLAFLPRAWGGSVADRDRLASATTAARAALPRAVAEEHRFVPLEISGRKLTVACCVPDDLTAFEMALDEVGFALSLYLRPLWTTEPLNARELHRLYGTPIPARLRALVDDAGGPSSSPTPATAPATTAGPTSTKTDATPATEFAEGERVVPAAVEDQLRFTAVVDATAPADPDGADARTDAEVGGGVGGAATDGVPGSAQATVVGATWTAPPTSRFDASRTPTPPAAMLFPSLAARDPSGWMVAPRGAVLFDGDGPTEATHLSLVVDGTVATSVRTGVVADGAPGKPARLSAPPPGDERTGRHRRRTKVLWNLEDAAAELALADTRDEILEVACRFAWRRLNTAAVVIRQGDRFVVWDILDPIHDGAALRRFPMPATGDHALARALSSAGPSVGPVGVDDPLCRLLGRTPHALLIVPIAVGGRLAGALVGDNGERPVPPTVIAELQRIAPRIGAALAALIVRQKRSASTLPKAAPPTLAPTFVDAFGDVDLRLSIDATEPSAARALLAPPGEDEAPDVVVGAELAAVPAGVPPTGPPARAPAVPGASAREAVLLATWRRWLDGVPDDEDAIVARLADGDGAAARLLVDARERALPALARAFPGTLVEAPFVGRPMAIAQLAAPPFASVLGVLAALGADAAAAIAVGALDHPTREHRWAATRLLAAVDVPAALPRLAARLFDDEGRIARAALEVLALRRTSPGFADVLVRLRELARRGDDDERVQAIAALATLRDARGVSVLVDLVPERPARVAEAAHDALVRITRADFGFAERRWRAWLSAHGDEPRRRWLLRALRQGDVSLRRAAAVDLVDDGVPLFGFDADASAIDRDVSVGAIARHLGEPPP